MRIELSSIPGLQVKVHIFFIQLGSENLGADQTGAFVTFAY